MVMDRTHPSRSRHSWIRTVTLLLLSASVALPVSADYLIWSGRTHWEGELYGVIASPQPTAAGTNLIRVQGPSDSLLLVPAAATQLPPGGLTGIIVREDDTVVYDTVSGTYQIHVAQSPSQVIGTRFAEFDPERDASAYWDAAGTFNCAPSETRLNTTGVLIHLTIGSYPVCTRNSYSILGPPGDPDNDEVVNEADNCPTAKNPDQANNDLDGLGDLCDPDDDNDGLSDFDENVFNTDPFNPDTDGDGLSDGDEATLGTDPLKADTDGDGMNDGEEIDEGLNPLDGTDCPSWFCGGSSVLKLLPLLQDK